MDECNSPKAFSVIFESIRSEQISTLICTETLLYVACLIFLKSSWSGKAVLLFILLFLSAVCINVWLNAFHIKLSYLGFSPGWRWERGKNGIQRNTTDAGHSIFVLPDDAEVLQHQVQYWAHKKYTYIYRYIYIYNLQVLEWLCIGLVNVC